MVILSNTSPSLLIVEEDTQQRRMGAASFIIASHNDNKANKFNNSPLLTIFSRDQFHNIDKAATWINQVAFDSISIKDAASSKLPAKIPALDHLKFDACKFYESGKDIEP